MPAVTAQDPGSPARPLDPRHDLRTHSPAGFEWGYAGSGPAQLALALAADATGDDERTLRCYQALKVQLVARFPAEGFAVTAATVREVVADIEQAREKPNPAR